MNRRAQIRLLPDGCRLHLHDGPIDVIAEAFGDPRQIQAAYRSAAARFVDILDELCAELSFLRQPVHSDSKLPDGRVAGRMVNAVRPYSNETFITAMAAVAGAVAEEILQAMVSNATLTRAYANDGGDIALHLSAGEHFVVGMVERPDHTSFFGTTVIDAGSSIRGIATSGWRGRSFSLGIADAVTILADTAAMADAAATVVGNAVDLPGHPQVGRVRACDLAQDSDLAERLVTQSVGELGLQEITQALARGVKAAESLRAQGLIRAAAIHLQGNTRVTGPAWFPLAEQARPSGGFLHG
jgi:ApbE superfamily uncharacterized protein (UPF0280 family)